MSLGQWGPLSVSEEWPGTASVGPGRGKSSSRHPHRVSWEWAEHAGTVLEEGLVKLIERGRRQGKECEVSSPPGPDFMHTSSSFPNLPSPQKQSLLASAPGFSGTPTRLGC